MAKPSGVWGIDIGQCALKALRCQVDGDTVVADAFDFVEYPKLLSQPDANPQQLIKEALEQFLSRNDLKGDKVAISVAGQAGLARYFKPPPVDAKKIADIVKYEARQQIPFPLEDVIWDYQRMGGGTEVDGIALETEVGLFAMKREQVYKSLHPYVTSGVAVDIIQLAPLAIYNYVVYDLLEATMPPPDQFDPEKPPPSTVVVSIGTDTTDLVVTNGYRVWQRNIPLGGNHFTKQLTKELKLTFAKAEHMKRNAHQAEDPKAIFQAMRSVFSDMVTELQRSLNFFQNLDRKATIANVVILGNTIKLPGLKQYLTKHLGYDVLDFESFARLKGDAVVNSPAFRDNLLAFGPCYGLCLQALNRGKLGTNLLPMEITTERIIKAKKPWAVAASATFLLGCAFNYIFHYVGWKNVHPDIGWSQSIAQVSNVSSMSNNFRSQDDERKRKLEVLTKVGQEVVGDPDRRVLWLELIKAVSVCMPETPKTKKRIGGVLDPNEVPFGEQQELHIEMVESQYFPDLKTWFESGGGVVKKIYTEQSLLEKQKYLAAEAARLAAAAAEAAPPAGTPPAGTPGAAQPGVGGAVPPGPPAGVAGPTPPPAFGAPSGGAPGAGGAAGAASTVAGPQGPGWVIELRGFHYFNDNPETAVGNHVRRTLILNLQTKKVKLPVGNGEEAEFTMEEMGIGYPILAEDSDLVSVKVENPNYIQPKVDAGGFGGPLGTGGPLRPAAEAEAKDKEKDKPKVRSHWDAKKYSFVVQFAWQEKPLRQRLEAKAKAEAAAAPVGVAGAGPAPGGAFPAPAANPLPAVPVAPAPVASPPAAPPVAPPNNEGR